jgi:putative transcriptional regulator
MKAVQFNKLLQGIREAGAYLRGNKKAASRVDRINPEAVTTTRARLRLGRYQRSSG